MTRLKSRLLETGFPKTMIRRTLLAGQAEVFGFSLVTRSEKLFFFVTVGGTMNKLACLSMKSLYSLV
jgi:hypothetical protein